MGFVACVVHGTARDEVLSSLLFYIILAIPTVPWAPGVPKTQNYYFLMYTCEPFITGQGSLGAINYFNYLN